MKINQIVPFFSLVVIGVSLTILADIFLKKSNFHHPGYFAVGILLYALVAAPVAMAFKMAEFGILFVIWELLAIISGTAVAIVIYKEALTPSKALALIFAVVAVLLTIRE